MGKKIYQSLKEYDYNITGFDIFAKNRKNVITKIEDINIENYDWLVDFSEANISKKITKLFLSNSKNVISGTTGLTFDELNDFCILAKNNDAKYIHRVNFAKSFCEFEAIAKKIAQKIQIVKKWFFWRFIFYMPIEKRFFYGYNGFAFGKPDDVTVKPFRRK